MTNLVNQGYSRLKPLLDFRNWLMMIRDDKTYRLPIRRNGSKGPGPFTVNARREILSKLESAQALCGYSLIDKPQLDYIRKCWKDDMKAGL